MADQAPPMPDSEPVPPTRPPEYDPPVLYVPPRGDEPTDLEPGGLEEAAQAHAAGPAGPDLSNLGNVLDDRPHFARLLDGQDPSEAVCGQDGKPWPCPDAQKLTVNLLTGPRGQHVNTSGAVFGDTGSMVETPIQQAGNLNISGAMPATITLQEAAAAAGITAEEMRRRVESWRER